MKDAWYVVPAAYALSREAGATDDPVDENELDVRLLVLPPLPPRLPRRVRGKKKDG
jgi:hypothetical protein